MSSKVMIFGTASWPYTNKAREAYGDRAVFYDVGSDKKKLDEMLSLSGGRRQVPVIVEGDKVMVGFGGAWEVWLAGSLLFQLTKFKNGNKDQNWALWKTALRSLLFIRSIIGVTKDFRNLWEI